MRERLYCGKSKNTNEWVYGSYFIQLEEDSGTDYTYLCQKHPLLQKINTPEDIGRLFGVKVLSNTIRDYTGLKDRNGQKIFEGHIIKCHKFNYATGTIMFENCVVVWDEENACFALADITPGAGTISYRYNDYQMDDTHEFEIIGNIYDNPELLEEV